MWGAGAVAMACVQNERYAYRLLGKNIDAAMVPPAIKEHNCPCRNHAFVFDERRMIFP
jgi:hypothetical protein